MLPNSPGSLGRLAHALGCVDADIESVDVVEVFPDGMVMDDLVVSLAADAMADEVITAAQSVEGVLVDSIRPFSGRVDRRGQIAMLATVARIRHRGRALEAFVDAIPQSMTATWGVVLATQGTTHRVAASQAAPEDDHSVPEDITVDKARRLDPEYEDWIPESWALLDSELAATPLGVSGYTLVIGRTGGPTFLPTEVEHLGHLGEIVGRMLT